MDVKSYALGLSKLLVIALYDIRKFDRGNREHPIRALVLHPEHWCELRYEGKHEEFFISDADAKAGISRWRGIRVELSLNEDAHFITASGKKVYV